MALTIKWAYNHTRNKNFVVLLAFQDFFDNTLYVICKQILGKRENIDAMWKKLTLAYFFRYSSSPEAYLEPTQTSMVELFWENS